MGLICIYKVVYALVSSFFLFHAYGCNQLCLFCCWDLLVPAQVLWWSICGKDLFRSFYHRTFTRQEWVGTVQRVVKLVKCWWHAYFFLSVSFSYFFKALKVGFQVFNIFFNLIQITFIILQKFFKIKCVFIARFIKFKLIWDSLEIWLFLFLDLLFPYIIAEAWFSGSWGCLSSYWLLDYSRDAILCFLYHSHPLDLGELLLA